MFVSCCWAIGLRASPSHINAKGKQQHYYTPKQTKKETRETLPNLETHTLSLSLFNPARLFSSPDIQFFACSLPQFELLPTLELGITVSQISSSKWMMMNTPCAFLLPPLLQTGPSCKLFQSFYICFNFLLSELAFIKLESYTRPDDGIMELFWQNGPVVLPSQNHRPLRKPPPPKHSCDVTTSGPSTATEIEIRSSPQEENYNSQHLFMQEDEMASWLHCPIVDDSPLDHNFYADLLSSPHTAVNNSATVQSSVRTSQVTELQQPSTSVAPPGPSIPHTWGPQAKIQESEHFSKQNTRAESGPSSSRTAARESTVVDSCDTPAVVATSRVSDAIRSTAEPTEGAACCGSRSTTGIAGPSTTSAGGGTEAMTCEMTATSSPGGSTGNAEQSDRSPAEDRKRKGRDADDSECHIEKDLDYEPAEAEKQVRESKSTKRYRAAEVHNLSERRRRDKINEKMRDLKELIPRCNKSDKASMLDEAIEYLKSLQLQVQMMSMGCGMVPMMYPGMPAMGMGMVGMEMGMNRPVMPFPNMVAAAAAVGPAHIGPRSFSIPPFHVAAPDLSRMQAATQPDNMLPSLTSSDLIHSRIPNLTHAYHQHLGPHQIQCHLMQNQTMIEQDISNSKPSTGRAHENPENHQSGENS